MKSKALIEKQLKRKTNSDLIETVIACKKNKSWIEIASILSGLSKDRIILNLDLISKQSKDGENNYCSRKSFICWRIR
jgi:hypothetical protein